MNERHWAHQGEHPQMTAHYRNLGEAKGDPIKQTRDLLKKALTNRARRERRRRKRKTAAL